MILLAIILSLLYWLISATFDFFIFKTANLTAEIFIPVSYVLWMRLWVVFFIITLSVYFKININRRKKTEDELSIEHGLIPSALDKANILLFVFDTSGHIVRFNRVCEQLTGRSFYDMRDKYFWKLFPYPQESEKVKNSFHDLQKGKFPKEFQGHWADKDGSYRLIRWCNTIIYDKKNTVKYVLAVGIDITVHQQIKDVLKNFKQDHKSIIDAIDIGISLVSADLNIVYMNEQIKKWFPEVKISQRSIGHDAVSNYSEENCGACPVCAALKDGKPHETLLRIPAGVKGTIYRVAAFPIEDDEKRVVSVIETIEDYSRVDKQEEEIRQNYLIQAVINSLLRFSLENISVEGFLRCALNVVLSAPWFSFEPMGAIYLVEDDFETLTLKAQNGFPPSAQTRYKKVPFGKHLCGQAASSGKLQFTNEPESSFNVVFTITASYTQYCVPIMYAGGILGVLEVYVRGKHSCDRRKEEFLIAIANSIAGVIQRKLAEVRLEQINKCFINLGISAVDNIKNLIGLCGKILKASSVIYSRLNSSEEADLFVQNASFSDNPNMAEFYKNVSGEVIRGEDETSILHNLPKIQYSKKDASDMPQFKTCIGQKVNYSGKNIGVICIFLKEEVTLENKDRQFLGIIASAIGIEEERVSANKELKEAYLKLEQAQSGLVQSEKLAALGRFSTGIAHEVKNPLGIILGGIEFLSRKLQSTDKDVNIALTKIKESTLRADGIVRNLLKFGRPSDIKKETIRPRDLVNNTLDLFKYRDASKNIDIHTDFSEEDIFIDVDRNQLEQVLFNLIQNAIQAMPKGGVINVKTYKTLIEDVSKNQPAGVIEVADNGEGITKENLAKLFEPFFTTKRDKKGTGLGLSMSRMIIQNHKGLLKIESKVNKGTTVRIIIPLVQPGQS